MSGTDNLTGSPSPLGALNHDDGPVRQSMVDQGKPPILQAPPVQTLARAYEGIRAGGSPWVAINEFFHEWLDYSRDHREALIAEPIQAGDVSHESDLWRWAVFCAAAADYLCERYQVARPSWVSDPAYMLAEPWYGFGDVGAATPAVRAHLEQVTPELLRRRNIFGGDKVFANKYELRKGMPAQEE